MKGRRDDKLPLDVLMSLVFEFIFLQVGNNDGQIKQCIVQE